MSNTQATFPLTSVTSSLAIFGTPLGAVVEDGLGRRFRAVRFLDAVTYLAGHSVTYGTGTTTTVTNDRAGGTATTTSSIAGVLVPGGSIPAQNDYGWIQTWGPCATILMNNDDDAAIGDAIIISSSDGLADTIAVATTTADMRTIGRVVTAVVAATNVVNGYLCCS